MCRELNKSLQFQWTVPPMESAAVEDHENQEYEDPDHKSKGENKNPAKGFGNFFGCIKFEL